LSEQFIAKLSHSFNKFLTPDHVKSFSGKR